LAEDFRAHLKRPAKTGDILPIGTIALVAHKVANGRVVTVGLRLADPDPQVPVTRRERARVFWRRVRNFVTG
jgi:hypothetical protein